MRLAFRAVTLGLVIDLGSTTANWPEPTRVSLTATNDVATLGRVGDTSRVSDIASISKLFAAVTCLVAVEEGTLDLDEPAGRPGATVRHLLAHAAGYHFDQPGFAADIGRRRVYSNVGVEILADHLARRAELSFDHYQYEAVIAPLGLTHTELRGSPAADIHSNIDDLGRFARELLAPTLVHRTTLHAATQPHFPDLSGVLPGWGRFDPLPWGLGFEIKGHKSPHWSGSRTSPVTFGHFGASGTYLFVDPDLGLAVAAIAGSPFGPWARDAWPTTNDAVLDQIAGITHLHGA